jgi:hypothetical protein
VQVALELGARRVGGSMMRRRATRSSSARACATSRSRAASWARRCSSTSLNAVTDPRPSGSSNGADE